MKWHAGSGLDSHWRALVIGVVGYAFLLRLLFIARVELLPEEAYYWNYSRHLDIGYLDHPPMVAWLIRGGTSLFGNTELGVRFPAWVCGIAAGYFMFSLTRNLFGQASAWLALLFAQVLPYFFLSGMLMTPDAPLTVTWAASLYFLERALVAGRPCAWLGAGLSLGAGLLSKYTIGLVGIAAFSFMVFDPPSRRWFRRWEPYAGVLLAGAVFAPVIIWNAQHDWASFAFQTSRRLAEKPRFSLHKLIGAAMVLLTPTGLVAVWTAYRGGSPQSTGVEARDRDTRARRFMNLCLAVPLIVFALFSLRHEVKLDWTGAPWLAALPMLASALAASYEHNPPKSARWLRIAWPPTLIAMLLVYAAGLWYLAFGLPGMGYGGHPELVPVGWRDLGSQIDSIAGDVRAKQGADALVIGMDRYAIASELAFYSADQINSVSRTSAAHLFDDKGLMYEQWFPKQLQSGRTLLLVAWDAAALAEPHLRDHVASLGPIESGAVTRTGVVVRHYYYRIASGYLPTKRF